METLDPQTIKTQNKEFNFGLMLERFKPESMNKSEYARALGMSHLNSLKYATSQANGNLENARVACSLYPVPLYTFFMSDFNPNQHAGKINMIQSNLITGSTVGNISYSGSDSDGIDYKLECEKLRQQILELKADKDKLYQILLKGK